MDKKRNKNTRSESEKKKMYEIARMYTCSKGKNDAVAAGIETDTVTMTDAHARANRSVVVVRTLRAKRRVVDGC